MKEAGSSPTKVAPVNFEEIKETYVKGKIARWGDANNFPDMFLKKYRLNGAATGGLRVLKAVHYGGGFLLTKTEVDENGKRTTTPKRLKDYPEINSFYRRNRMPHFWLNIICFLGNFF